MGGNEWCSTESCRPYVRLNLRLRGPGSGPSLPEIAAIAACLTPALMSQTAFSTESTEDVAKNFTNDSAMMIAYERSLESSRDGALLMDPFAHILAGPKGKILSDRFEAGCGQFGLEGWPTFHKTWTAVRTHFIDEHIARSLDGVRTQVVNLGAGLDTRAYRLESFQSFKGSFEVDMAVVNHEKRQIFEQVLRSPAPKCDVRSVDLDFLDDNQSLRQELSAAGFVAAEPSVFLAEGLIMYLGPTGKLKLIREVSACAAPGSLWLLQFLDPSEGPNAAGEQAKYGLTREEAQRHLQEYGWKELQFWKFGDEGLNFGRFPLDQFKPCAAFSFVVAVKC